MKKYNLSEIMRTANSFAKTLNRSEALRRAWALAKIDNQISVLDLADHWTAAESEAYSNLTAERNALCRTKATRTWAEIEAEQNEELRRWCDANGYIFVA